VSHSEVSRLVLSASFPGFRNTSRRNWNARRYGVCLSLEMPRCGKSHRRASEPVPTGSRYDAPRRTSWLGTSFVGWRDWITLARCDFQLLLAIDQQSSTQECPRKTTVSDRSTSCSRCCCTVSGSSPTSCWLSDRFSAGVATGSGNPIQQRQDPREFARPPGRYAKRAPNRWLIGEKRHEPIQIRPKLAYPPKRWRLHW